MTETDQQRRLHPLAVRAAAEPDYPIWARMLTCLHSGQSEADFLRELRDLVALNEPYVGFLAFDASGVPVGLRSEEHTSELQSLMRISYAVFCLKKKNYTRYY